MTDIVERLSAVEVKVNKPMAMTTNEFLVEDLAKANAEIERLRNKLNDIEWQLNRRDLEIERLRKMLADVYPGIDMSHEEWLRRFGDDRHR